MICLPGKKKIYNAASPPIRAIAYCMSVTYMEIIRANVNHTSVCTIRRVDSCFSASDGGILKAARYNPSRPLLQGTDMQQIYMKNFKFETVEEETQHHEWVEDTVFNHKYLIDDSTEATYLKWQGCH